MERGRVKRARGHRPKVGRRSRNAGSVPQSATESINPVQCFHENRRHRSLRAIGRRAVSATRRGGHSAGHRHARSGRWPGGGRPNARLKPAAIINCAAYTQVDKAESEPEMCRAVNATAVEHLAQACGKLDCPLVQISTDYLFGAATPEPRPWREDDPPSPQGVYARTKLEGEQAAARYPKHLIVRTCGLYARPSDPRAANFVGRCSASARTRPEAARRGRSTLHADLRAASGPGDSVSARGRRRPAGPVGNVSRDEHRPDDLARVCRRNLPSGGNAVTLRRSHGRFGCAGRGPPTACSTPRPIIDWAARRCPTGKPRWPSILSSGRNVNVNRRMQIAT